jgi:hypothetical protein
MVAGCRLVADEAQGEIGPEFAVAVRPIML